MQNEWTPAESSPPNDPSFSAQEGDDAKDDLPWLGISDQFMEAMVRVTFAGFAGALVGLSHQKRVQATKIFQRSVSSKAAGNRAPPMPPKIRSTQAEENLPVKWAVSFAAFVAILETSRFWSVSSTLIHLMEDLQNANNDDENDDTTRTTADMDLQQDAWYKHATATTIMDYTLGGAVAGLAAGMAKKGPATASSSSSTSKLQMPSAIIKSGRLALLSQIGTGVILGVLAGACQAGLDTAEDYVRGQELEQQLEQAKEEQERLVLFAKEQQQKEEEEQAEGQKQQPQQ